MGRGCLYYKDGHAAGARSEGNGQGEGFRWGKVRWRRDKRRHVNTISEVELGEGAEDRSWGSVRTDASPDRAGGFSEKEAG